MRHHPNLPEIFRTDTNSVESAVAHLMSALTPSGVTWNYLDSVKRVKSAYQGLHNLDVLTNYTASHQKRPGYKSNRIVTELACPIAFGRNTQVNNLSPRKLPYQGERFASYRIPFFFVENGIVKVYFLQTRKNGSFQYDQICGMATAVKLHLLDTEFYGENVDIEVVDLGVPIDSSERAVRVFTMDDLELWSESKLNDHFHVIVEALEFIEAENLVPQRRRPLKDKEFPLFD